MKYDDGFIAYINGTRVASANAPEVGAFDSTATDQHLDSDAVEYVDFDVREFFDSLVVGSNTLAIHMLNRNSGSSDLLSVPQLNTVAGSLIEPTIEGKLVAPTPGLPNPNALAKPVEFSRDSGTLFASFLLQITSSGANETIRYTTNGSMPTATSTAYSSPITVSTTTQIRAAAFGPSGQVGLVTVGTFSETDATTFNFTSDLPIIVIETLGQSISIDELEDAALALYDIDETTGRSSLADPADVTSLIGQRRRGSSTFNNLKPNLRIELRDVFGEDQAQSLLGLPSESDFILTGPYQFDRSMIRDTLLHDLSNQIGQYAVGTRFVEVYGNTNGDALNDADYLGVYVLLETIKRDSDRVDIEALEPSQIAEPEITGGYIIKIDRTDGESGSNWSTSRGVPNRGGASFVHVEPERVDLADEQVDYIRGYVQDLEDALYGPNSTDPELGYAAYLDVEASLDHHIIRTLSLEPDSLGLSTYLYKDRGEKLAFGPIWDFDRSMGSDVDLRSSDTEVWFSGVDFFEFDWWGELFKDPDFLQGWVDRWQELREKSFSDQNILLTLQGQASQLEEAQVRNFERWTEFSPNGGEFAEPGLTGWEAEVSHLVGWLMARVDWIDDQLVTVPSISPEPGSTTVGTQVVITSPQPEADIYYTLDGSDPRLNGGGLSPNAILYTGPITITETVQIATRAMATPTDSVGQTPGSSPWSSLSIGSFSIEAPADASNLRITELHYNPLDPTPAELLALPGIDNNSFEFIELLNVSTAPIDLNGVQLIDGVTFDFSGGNVLTLLPGETVLVVENREAFELRNGIGLPIAGEYDGRLSGGGETIELVDREANTIVAFEYSDDIPWPVAADGDGPSLELIDPLGDYTQGSNWQASIANNGSPGSATAPLHGDYDRSGVVDTQDWSLWTSQYGTTFAVAGLGADGNRDGIINAADYTIWRDALNQFETASIAVSTSSSVELAEKVLAVTPSREETAPAKPPTVTVNDNANAPLPTSDLSFGASLTTVPIDTEKSSKPVSQKTLGIIPAPIDWDLLLLEATAAEDNPFDEYYLDSNGLIDKEIDDDSDEVSDVTLDRAFFSWST